MDNLYELIKKADNGDAEAQWRVAWHIVWDEETEPIEPDWLERALDYFERSASQGYGDAMLDLGALYRVGRGVSRDIEKAFYWFNQAASILHPKAFRCLGYALEIPVGYLDPYDEADKEGYKNAYKYFIKGAILNEQNSIYKIGDMYYSGKYVDADREFAFFLYQQSYDCIEYIDDDSYASVCLRLGECYCYGTGTAQDIGKATDYINKAIKGFEIRINRDESPDYFMGGYNRAKLLLKRIRTNKIKEVSSNQEDMKDNAYAAFLESDMLKYPEPHYPIAELDALKAENPKISQWDSFFNDELAAAESGDEESMYHIAFYCLKRFGNESNSGIMKEFTLYYFHKAIRSGSRVAMYYLGDIYNYGIIGVEIDKNKAYLLYIYSETQIAWNELGILYGEGKIGEKDYEKAFMYFAKYSLTREIKRYASLGNLAIMYRNGYYVEPDEKFADFCEGERIRLEEEWRAENEEK